MQSDNDSKLLEEFLNMPLPENAETIKKSVVQTAKAISSSTHLCMVVLDMRTRSYLFVSDNSLLLCGQTPEEAKKKGFMFYQERVPADELPLMHAATRIGWEFFLNVPNEERTEYSFFYSYHIINDGVPLLITQKVTPIVTGPDGKTWLALSVFSIANEKTPGHLTMRKNGTSEVWKYDEKTESWKKIPKKTLTEPEKAVLILSAQGYTMDDIADKLHKNVDSVKYLKRRIFAKLNVKTITEALTMACNAKIIY